MIDPSYSMPTHTPTDGTLRLPMSTQKTTFTVTGLGHPLPAVPVVIGGVLIGRIRLNGPPSIDSGPFNRPGVMGFPHWIEPDDEFDLVDLLRVLGLAERPEQGTDGVDRLSTQALSDSADHLLERADGDKGKVKALVVDLLRELRAVTEREQRICDGYDREAKRREREHQAEIGAALRHVANAIRREARRGAAGASGRQEISYAGGLRRAARIVAGSR